MADGRKEGANPRTRGGNRVIEGMRRDRAICSADRQRVHPGTANSRAPTTARFLYYQKPHADKQ